jgi:hypothetical protein
MYNFNHRTSKFMKEKNLEAEGWTSPLQRNFNILLLVINGKSHTVGKDFTDLNNHTHPSHIVNAYRSHSDPAEFLFKCMWNGHQNGSAELKILPFHRQMA